MNDNIYHSSKSNEWETPKYVFNSLNDEFNFKLDAAATKENTLCSSFFTKENNALIQDWSSFKSIWCNPPYGKLIGQFLQKGYEESLKDSIVVFLIPARVDTKWWHNYCSKGEVRFIKGRLKFQNRTFPSWTPNNTHKISPASFPSAIIIFGPNILPQTKYIELRKN